MFKVSRVRRHFVLAFPVWLALFGLLFSAFGWAKGVDTLSLDKEVESVEQGSLKGTMERSEAEAYLAFLREFFQEGEKGLLKPMKPLERKVNHRLRSYYKWWKAHRGTILQPVEAYKLFASIHANKARWRAQFERSRDHRVPGDFLIAGRPVALEIASNRGFYLRLDPTRRGRGASKTFTIAVSVKDFTEVARLALDRNERDFLKRRGFEFERDLLERVRTCKNQENARGLVECFATANTVLYTRLYAKPIANCDWLGTPRVDEEILRATFRERLQGAVEILSGLTHLKNDFGVLHMDIKPENIFYLRDDSGLRFAVSDFGLSRTKDELSYVFDLPALGTPLFMAPELIWHDLEDRSQLPVAIYRTASYSMAIILQLLLEGGRFPSYIQNCLVPDTLKEYSACSIRSIIEGEKAAQTNPSSSWLELIHFRALNRSALKRPTLESLLHAYEWRLKNFPVAEADVETILPPAPSFGSGSRTWESSLAWDTPFEAREALRGRTAGSYELFMAGGRSGRVGIVYLAPVYWVYDRTLAFGMVSSSDQVQRVERTLLASSQRPDLVEEELEILKMVGILADESGRIK